ncbi:MAG: ABC-2 transporter permease [Acetivibrionales bacterium]|jgi:ABC-2 type transport system permease protein
MTKHLRLLVLKDFQVQLRSMVNYTFIGLAVMLVFALTGEGLQMAFPVWAFVIIYGFINKCLYEDEKNNTLRLLVSLPLKRDSIVVARYLSTAVMIIIAGAAMWFLNPLLSGILPAADIHAAGDVSRAIVNAFAVVGTSLVFMLIMSVYLPMAFKFGYIKAVNINRFVFLGTFMLFGAIPAISRLKGDNQQGSFPWMEQVELFIESIGPEWLIALFILFCACIYVLSMCLSIRFFRKRQLF